MFIAFFAVVVNLLAFKAVLAGGNVVLLNAFLAAIVVSAKLASLQNKRTVQAFAISIHAIALFTTVAFLP